MNRSLGESRTVPFAVLFFLALTAIEPVLAGAKIARPIAIGDDTTVAFGEADALTPVKPKGPAPANDTCAGAIPLTPNRITKGTTVDANDDYHSPATTACYSGVGQTPTTAPGRDVVYSFTAPADGDYSVRIVQQNPTDVIRTQNEVLYASDSCPASGTVNCLKGANRLRHPTLPSSTGQGNNQSEELDCLPMTLGQTIYVFFDDGAAGNAGGAMSLEPIECHRELEPNGTPATANAFVCGILGTSDVAPAAHCYLGSRAGNGCTRSTPLDPSFPDSNKRCTLLLTKVCVTDADCSAGEGVCSQQTDLDCDPRCDVGPNAGRPCTTNAFCNPVTDQGAICAGTCQIESQCVGGTNAGNPCTSVCVGGSFPGRYCSTLSGCPGGGVCTANAACPGGGVCDRRFNEGDEDFFSLGTVPAGNKVFAGIDAKSSNDYDWRMRITTTTDTLQFDDDDGVARNGTNAPEIAGAVAAGTETFIKVSRSAPRVSEPYELYAIVQGPLATAQLESEAGPTGNDINLGWPGDVSSANYINNVSGGNNGYLRGTFGTSSDSDCFKFIVNAGDLMSWYGDGEPARSAAAPTEFPEPIIYDAEPAGISNFIFSGNARKNVLTANNTLNGLSPAVTSTFFQWRASYTGMLEVCFYNASVALGLGNPGPGAWAGSLDVNCGPLRASGPGTTTTDVSVTQSGPAGPVLTGSFVTYTITVTNSSADIAQEVQLHDVLDPNLAFIKLVIEDGLSGPTGTDVTGLGLSNNTACINPDGSLRLPTAGANDAPIDCINTSMAPGTTTTYRVTAQVKNCIGAGLTISHTATISTVSTDPNASNDSTTTSFATSEDGTCVDTTCSATECTTDHCTTTDHCEAGVCVTAPLDCDDHSVCTADSCDPAVGCIHDSSQLGDLCDDFNPCTSNACDPISFCVFPPLPAGPACDDGLNCTTSDHCDGQGNCVGVSVCDDGNPCSQDFADEFNACACSHPPATSGTACTDGNVCTTSDACNGAGTCVGGTPLNCDDGDACTGDSCSPGTGCAHATINCDDGNPCTTDSCNPATGCVHTGGDCVVAVDPPDNTTGTQVSTSVTLTYSDPIDPVTVTASTFRLVGPGEVAVPANFVLSTDGKRPTLDPVAALAPDTTYRVETTSGIHGPGSTATQPFTSYFRTGQSTGSTDISNVSEPTSPLPTSARGGSSIARAGDLNGDGAQDVITGAPGYQDPVHGVPVEAGAALVYLGSAVSGERTVPDIIFTGATAHDRAGVSVAGDFDFNGDGRRDIVIGAEQVDRSTNFTAPTPTGSGKVYLIFFDPSDTVHYPNLADPSVPDTVSLSLVGQPGGIPGVVFSGAALGDQAGFSVAGGGTSTAGGGQDIVIGAPGADPGSRTDAGAAYVVFDSPTLNGDVSLTRISDGLPDQVPGKAYLGAESGDNLGFSTGFAGDVVSGQTVGTGSVLMGAPSAGGQRGIAACPPGDPDTTPIIVDAVGTTRPGLRFVGTQAGEKLGFAVSSGGDALADGVPDLLIGAPTYDVGGVTDAGRVIQTSQIIPSGVYGADAVGTTIHGVTWTGEASGDQLGSAVASVRDVTGDGYDDIVLGAPFVDPVVGGNTLTDAGAVYLIAGSPSTGNLGTLSVAEVGTTVAGQEITGTVPGEHAGSSIAGTGDISGDGRNDFAVGAPDSAAQSGTVELVLHNAPSPVGSCGAAGCVVADLLTGAEVDVRPGALAAPTNITVEGIADVAGLPAPVPAGKMLLGAARFTPDGQAVSSPFATVYVPIRAAAVSQSAPGEVLPISYYNGAGWVATGINGTTGADPSYPSQRAVSATVDVLRVYAVFVDDADGDGVRDGVDNCPAVGNPTQIDTDQDGIGDACECVNVNCDDANVCTDDGCNPLSGCVHANNAADCDDGNPCTVGDICGGGTCSGAPAPSPGELQNSRFTDKSTYVWDTIPDSPRYDVVRGSLASLPVGPGGGDELCSDDLLTAVLVDSTTPSPGAGFWYVTRGEGACGNGTFGYRSNGTERVTTTCP